MMDWFKEGNVLPRRIAWQIILGAYEVLKEEETLVDVEIPQDQTIDVYVTLPLSLLFSYYRADRTLSWVLSE